MRKYWKSATARAVLVTPGLVLVLGLQTAGAQDVATSRPPLVTRGYTDATAGTVAITGGGSVLELRVKEGQKVKKGDIIAVMTPYPTRDVAVQSAEAELDKMKQKREAMASGYRKTEIEMQEIAVRQAEKESQLKALEMQRSSLPDNQKEIEISVSRQKLEQDRAKLKTMQETLVSDLAQANSDVAIRQARVDKAIAEREQALVRATADGVVVQIWTHPGERENYQGIAKIVDMSQMRVVADIDETDLARVAVGGKVDVTFAGSNTVYRGAVSRIAPAVKRMQQAEPTASNATDSRVVQIEVTFDDLAHVPQVIGREVRVSFR